MNIADRFRDVVTTLDQLRRVIGSPSARAARKEMQALDAHAKAYISRCPFVLVATSDARGRMDVSPKGDPPGFVRVLDDVTLAIPDRPGNRRADGFANLIENPRIGLLFLVPGRQETLRVNGAALIVRDAALRESLAVNGKAPELALVVGVEQVFFHCAKCVVRSRLWDSQSWGDASGLASLAEVLVSQLKLAEPVAEVQAHLDRDAVTRLY